MTDRKNIREPRHILKEPSGSRDPAARRTALLEAARRILSQDGIPGLTVTRVANLAGLRRGTAYNHFRTREALVEASAADVSNKLHRAVYAAISSAKSRDVNSAHFEHVIEQLVHFAMDNPELGRVWLSDVLSSRRLPNDRFWTIFKKNFKKFANSDLAQSGIDIEVNSVLMLTGIFLWPVWARAHLRTKSERHRLAIRFSSELLRLCLHGALRPEMFPHLEALRKGRNLRSC